MNTHRSHSKLFFMVKTALLMVVVLNLTGCLTKYCPVPVERQPFITSTPWRLVSTNDRDFAGLNKYSFVIYTFNQDFSGKVEVVQNNTRYESPIRLMSYDVDSQQKLLRIQYAFPGGGTNSGNNSGGSNNDTLEYSYKLGRVLVLSGYDGTYYNFVPFTGIISPDDTCEFNPSLF